MEINQSYLKELTSNSGLICNNILSNFGRGHKKTPDTGAQISVSIFFRSDFSLSELNCSCFNSSLILSQFLR